MQMRTTLFHSVSPFSQNQTAFLDVKNGENVWRKKNYTLKWKQNILRKY